MRQGKYVTFSHLEAELFMLGGEVGREVLALEQVSPVEAPALVTEGAGVVLPVVGYTVEAVRAHLDGYLRQVAQFETQNVQGRVRGRVNM